jgi:hypothetical protein
MVVFWIILLIESERLLLFVLSTVKITIILIEVVSRMWMPKIILIIVIVLRGVAPMVIITYVLSCILLKMWIFRSSWREKLRSVIFSMIYDCIVFMLDWRPLDSSVLDWITIVIHISLLKTSSGKHTVIIALNVSVLFPEKCIFHI